MDTAAHVFTAGSPAEGPSGEFNSDVITSGSSYEWTPKYAGEVPYYCMVHPWATGLITVQGVVDGKLSIPNAVLPTDIDTDGISNEYDQCQTQAETINGFDDFDGCPETLPLKDSDGDGISDDYDKCPTQSETINNYQDTDGCPDTMPIQDLDKDGISDDYDKCPTQSETINNYQDTDGCSDTNPATTDTDSDGISDEYDKCTTQVETINNYQDTDGCPDTVTDPVYKDAYDLNYNTARDDSRKKQRYQEQYAEPTNTALQKHVDNPEYGLVKGQWVKYKPSITGVTLEDRLAFVKTASLTEISSLYQISDTDSIKMEIVDVSDSQVTVTGTGVLHDGEEKRNSYSIELGEFYFAIPTNTKIGDMIDFGGNKLVAKEYVQKTINGKQVDAIRAEYKQRLDMGFQDNYIEYTLENLYHKDSGILLSMKLHTVITGVDIPKNMSLSLEPIEISENLQKKQTFIDSFSDLFSQIAGWFKRI